MSGVAGVSGISGQIYGPLTQIIDNATATQAQLDKLTGQSSSGLIAQTYAGLGAAAAQTVLSVAPQISSANAQIAAINASSGPISVQQSALTEISALTTGIVAAQQPQHAGFARGEHRDHSRQTGAGAGGVAAG
jgi:flagellar hook-associated protein 3 FlgL